jgi:hypothetical protein
MPSCATLVDGGENLPTRQRPHSVVLSTNTSQLRHTSPLVGNRNLALSKFLALRQSRLSSISLSLTPNTHYLTNCGPSRPLPRNHRRQIFCTWHIHCAQHTPRSPPIHEPMRCAAGEPEPGRFPLCRSEGRKVPTKLSILSRSIGRA